MINYVRIPVAFSLLLLLTFFPLILGLSEPEYHRASGLTTQPYLWRWLAVTGVLFAVSAVIYALRWRRAAARARRRGCGGPAGRPDRRLSSRCPGPPLVPPPERMAARPGTQAQPEGQVDQRHVAGTTTATGFGSDRDHGLPARPSLRWHPAACTSATVPPPH